MIIEGNWRFKLLWDGLFGRRLIRKRSCYVDTMFTSKIIVTWVERYETFADLNKFGAKRAKGKLIKINNMSSTSLAKE